jgi:glutamyl-tRNA reductase
LSTDLNALLSNARWMTAQERSDVARSWSATHPKGSLLLETCHRVELYGSAEALRDVATSAPGGVRQLTGRDVAEHVVRIAVGRDSSVIAEDQILHQLRRATQAARRDEAMPASLDRLLDMALRAGRRARSWLPARRPTLVDIAIARAAGASDLACRDVLVVGTGEMGLGAIANMLGRDARVLVASRTIESAQAAAARTGAVAVSFDPGADVSRAVAGVVIALRGPWTIETTTRTALAANGPWIVDLSAPPAVDPDLARALEDRLLSIDDLVSAPEDASSTHHLLGRLDALVDATVADYELWEAAHARRDAADALNTRARELSSAELERLWRRVPTLDPEQRAEVARALDRLTADLLRAPLEQLGHDADDRHVRAARELFRL